MLDKLFSSKARVEVLKLFLFNPDDSFYQRQISMRTHQPIREVQRSEIGREINYTVFKAQEFRKRIKQKGTT